MVTLQSNTIMKLLSVADLGDVVALAGMKARAGRDGRTRASLPTIAHDLGWHPRTMRKHVRALVELGFVVEEPGGRGRA